MDEYARPFEGTATITARLRLRIRNHNDVIVSLEKRPTFQIIGVREGWNPTYFIPAKYYTQHSHITSAPDLGGRQGRTLEEEKELTA